MHDLNSGMCNCGFNFQQVILDVVYNHTNEADDKYPYTTSFRGIDNKVTGSSHIRVDQLVYLLLRDMNSRTIGLCERVGKIVYSSFVD